MAMDEGATEPTRDVQLVRTLLSEAREESLKADNKAGFLLASMGAALTALLGAIIGDVIEPRGHAIPAQILLWAGCVTCLASLTLLGMAITPRLGRPQLVRAHYFGDVNRAVSVVHVQEAVRRTDPLERDLSQLRVMSRTVWIKYRCIRHAMVWSAAFVTLTLLGILIGTSN
ncbi:Pycsar system effector family protein [Streptomyces sp. 8P21H-1]|uniref:Pycsar system effector family protein n=1 Tax=Streptomyces sp. 8P21H-1 TaxID=2737048 RepID=UPI00156DFC0C|nr:Pycsar system effector family protein [Streptomyces sp. 8P21H-1]NSL43053.1 hypothetical protein [Streptomyces sp. 8P21H-1]